MTAGEFSHKLPSVISLSSASGRLILARRELSVSSMHKILRRASSGVNRGLERKLHFWTWALTDGQDIAGNAGYTELPSPVAAKAREVVNSIQ